MRGSILDSNTPVEEKSLPVAELFKKLEATEKRLSSSELAKRLQQYGPNEITEKKRSSLIAFLLFFWGPIPGMIEAAPIKSKLHMTGKRVGKDEAMNALRTVAPDKAFTFFSKVGKPLGATSKSLDEFAAIVKSVDPSSVKLHIERGDFEGWFAMLGDKSLAGQIAALRGKKISPGKLRDKVSSMVSKRLDKLHEIAGSKGKDAQVLAVSLVRS